jgi:hypothetical protein
MQTCIIFKTPPLQSVTSVTDDHDDEEDKLIPAAPSSTRGR